MATEAIPAKAPPEQTFYERLLDGIERPRVADVGTGSGAIALSLVAIRLAARPAQGLGASSPYSRAVVE